MESDSEGHPVTVGLIALVSVGLVVGLLVSGAALAATSILGLGGDSGSTTTTSEQSMYLPRPVPTDPATGPLVTLHPGQEKPQQPEGAESEESEEAEPKFTISLSAGQTTVGPMQNIDLTGVYPGGEGAVVQVQRFMNGEWVDFASVDAVVTNETFATYVQTGQSGLNRFRVRDTSHNEVSNEVRVRVS